MEQDLENRIQELEQWKAEREKQQIVFPLDIPSQIILNKYYLSVIGNIFNLSVSGQEFRNIIVKQDGKVNVISVLSLFITFVANSTTDVFTLGANLITGTQGILSNDSFVTVYSTGDTPMPLLNGFGCYVVNSTGTTIQLSDTKGGSPIDITTVGTGDQYFGI